MHFASKESNGAALPGYINNCLKVKYPLHFVVNPLHFVVNPLHSSVNQELSKSTSVIEIAIEDFQLQVFSTIVNSWTIGGIGIAHMLLQLH